MNSLMTLLWLGVWWDYDDYTERIKLLLRRGASPTIQDNWGDTCLHLCLRELPEKVCLESMIILITGGADVHAVNNAGKSVTELAYQTPQGGDRLFGKFRKILRNRGLLWERALEACGYDAISFRQDFMDAGGHLPADLSDLESFSDSEEETDMDLDHYSPSSQSEGSIYILHNKEQTSFHDQSKTISPTTQENVNPGASLHVNDPQATDVLSSINPNWTLSDSVTANRSSSQSNNLFPPWSAAPNQNFPREFFSGDEPSLWGVEDLSHVESYDYLTDSRLVDQNVTPSQDNWSTYTLNSKMPRVDLGQSSRVWDLEDWEAEPNVWADEGH